MSQNKIDLELDQYLLSGFLPRAYSSQELEPRTLYRNYVKTYLERDVRKISKVHGRAPELFKRNTVPTPASDIYSLGMV